MAGANSHTCCRSTATMPHTSRMMLARSLTASMRLATSLRAFAVSLLVVICDSVLSAIRFMCSVSARREFQ